LEPGEVSTLFLWLILHLSKQNVHIDACIDDTKPEGMLKHGIPVYPSSWLDTHQTDLLLLAVNKKLLSDNRGEIETSSSYY
jgi:hypothetical protein